MENQAEAFFWLIRQQNDKEFNNGRNTQTIR